jgi:hypothetical protein
MGSINHTNFPDGVNPIRKIQLLVSGDEGAMQINELMDEEEDFDEEEAGNGAPNE